MKCETCGNDNDRAFQISFDNEGTRHVLCISCAYDKLINELEHLQETAYCTGWKQGYLHFEVEPWNMDAIALMQEAYTNYKHSIK